MTFNFKSHNDKRRHNANIAEKYDFQDFWETWDLGAKKKGNPKKQIKEIMFPETLQSLQFVRQFALKA